MKKTKISNKLFSTITISASIVLLISLLISLKVMNNIKNDNYEIIKTNLSNIIDQEVNAKMETGLTNAVTVASNADILLAIAENDKDLAYEVLTDIGKKYQKFTEFKDIKVHIHTPELKSFLRSWNREKNGDDISSFRHTIHRVKQTKEPVIAIEVGVVGLILRAIVPIMDEFGYNGSLEYLQGYESIIRNFEHDGGYLLVFTKKELLRSKPKKEKVVDDLVLSQNIYNKEFYKGFKNINFEKLLKKGYTADENYFYTLKPIIGFSDDIIGYYIAGEDIEKTQKIVSQSLEVVYLFIGMLVFLTIVIIIVINLSLQKLVVTNLYKVTDGLTGFFKYLNKENKTVSKISIDTYDEIGQMATEINSNMETIQKLIEQEDKQDWIKEGLNGLNETLSGDNDITSVANKSLKFISEYLHAGIGALYIYNENDDTLQLYGSYAFIQRQDLSNIFKVGEGVVGQVALQKSPIQLENIQRNQMVVSTGTTSESPLNTYTFPLVYQGSLYGVIELGSNKYFDQTQREFFELADTVIATALFSATQNNKVKDLLFKTQESNKKLQIQQLEVEEKNTALQKQQAELEEANSQMQEQQAQLEEANSQMQEQQAQLEETNAQMEEQQVQLKQSEKELKDQNQKLESSQLELEQKAIALEESNKYKSEFLANMSHELRTPLNSIILLSSMLKENKKENLSGDDIKKANIINNSGEELLRLINDVLDLSKVEAGRMELLINEFDSSNFANNLKDIFEPSATNNDLEFIVEDNYKDVITTDEDKLSQVIRNFLSNSLKFTHEGYIKLIVDPYENNHIKISVKDTGIGIAEDKQEDVFKAFTQADGSTSRKYGGTGLGLSITKELVNLMEGEITLKSKENEGSTFSIIIPNFDNKKPKTVKVHKEEKKVKKEEVKIKSNAHIDDSNKISSLDKPFLIIEDNETFAQTLKNVINENNELALIATSGQQGLELANRYSNIQGILLDLGLPDIDGIDVLKELKTNINTRKLPVYIISGRDSDNETKMMGAVGFKQKPLSNDDLNGILKDFSKFNSKKIKDLLIVEDDEIQREAIIEFIGNNSTNLHGVGGVEEAIKEIDKNIYDAVVIDLSLKGQNGLDVCEYIKTKKLNLPIIVYTGKELTQEEERDIKKYTDSIIIKSANSQNRLLDEVDMFLHRVKTQNNFPKKDLSAKNIDLSGKKVLVVDDDMRNTFVLVEILEEHGAEALTAADGKEALEVLDQNKDTSLVLMDIMMPVMDGYEAIERIRDDESIKDIPVIAVTAKAMPQDKEKSLEVGANDFLTKPLNLDTFVGVIQAWIK